MYISICILVYVYIYMYDRCYSTASIFKFLLFFVFPHLGFADPEPETSSPYTCQKRLPWETVIAGHAVETKKQ